MTAYGVCDDPEYFYDYVQGLVGGMGAREDARALLRCVQARGAGYAISTPSELATVQRIALATGIILDPVYTGKAVFAFLKEVAEDPAKYQGKTILFVHTGGLFGLYEQQGLLETMVAGAGRSERLFKD